MNGVLAAFQYREKDSPLHRLDPRAKLLLAFALVLFLWLRPELPLMALVAIPLAGLVVAGRVGREMAGPLRVYGLLGLVLLPLNGLLHSVYAPGAGTVLLWVTPPGTPVVGGLFLTQEALAFSLRLYVRLVLMLAVVSVFAMTTGLDEVEALLYGLRIPAFFILTLGFAFRFLPTLAEEAERIRAAQRARGLDLRRGGPLRRTWNALVPLFFPLVVSVLRRALRLAEALEVRGTFAHPRRTVMVDLTFRRADAAVALSALASLGTGLALLVVWPVV